MGTGHGAERGRVEAQRAERVLRADALLAEHALHPLPDDRVGQEVGGAHDEHAAARLVERPRADAREVGQQRAEARAPLEVAEEARVRRVRVVDDGRGAPRLVCDEQVHLEAIEARRELRVVALVARALLLLVRVLDGRRDRPSRRRGPAAPARARPAPLRRAAPSSRSDLRRIAASMTAAAAFENASSRAASNFALCARTRLRRLLDLARELVLGLGERALGGLVEDVELLGAHGLAVQDRETSARRRAPACTPKPSVLASDSSWWMTARFFASSSPDELRLRPLELLALDDGRDLALQALDERRPSPRRASAPCPGGRTSGRGASG